MAKKVLIIDDNKGDQVLMSEAFIDAGIDFEIIAADTGEAGVAKAKELKPDIVIIDTQLPGIDGFQVCRQIKEIDGGVIKVVVITGVFDAVNAVEARKSGADEYAVKTSDTAKIIEAVRQFI